LLGDALAYERALTWGARGWGGGAGGAIR